MIQLHICKFQHPNQDVTWKKSDPSQTKLFLGEQKYCALCIHCIFVHKEIFLYGLFFHISSPVVNKNEDNASSTYFFQLENGMSLLTKIIAHID